MKIRTISRSADDYVPVTNRESSRQPRNLNPEVHPFDRAREYTRALNAAKMDRMFAKPFLGQMGEGHIDGVYSLAKDSHTLAGLSSGSGDGVVKLWDAGSRQQLWSVQAHRDMVRGLCFTPEHQLLSCSSDATVKLWSPYSQSTEPSQTYISDAGLMSVDHHRVEPKFVTAGTRLEVWDVNRSKPTGQMSWGADNLNSVRFNQTEVSMVASTGSDRSIVIYDLRTSSPVQKLVTTLSSNSIAWNPMEAFNFAAASEDHNVYLYDMRHLKRSLNVYKDHVAAVMDVDWSPTGQELVTGSYDRTIRIFKLREGHSRDIYHTKRMQRVFSVKWSMDAKYLFSGSDDGNIRLWRAKANENSAVKSAKQRQKLEYDAAIQEKFKHMPDIHRIQKMRRVPKAIKKARNIKREELDAIHRRKENRIRHQKSGEAEKWDPERTRHIVGVGVRHEESR